MNHRVRHERASEPKAHAAKCRGLHGGGKPLLRMGCVIASELVLQRGELVLDDVGDELWVDAEVLVHHDVA
jgi:hypothetical protein